MKVLVIGKDGQLGRSIYKLTLNSKHDNDFIFVGRDELDLSKPISIFEYFRKNITFDLIINCAAYTAVDMAEDDQILADQINHLAVKQIAEIASTRNIGLLHISTDYVFDGKRKSAYVETDEPRPVNIYGKTKLSGERAIQQIMLKNSIIIRTSWLYSEFGKNFVKTIIDLGNKEESINVVSDQIGSPTYATDLANVILSIVNNGFNNIDKTDILHFSNEGEVSWYEFSKEIIQLSDSQSKLSPISSLEYRTKAMRPEMTALKTDKIKKNYHINIAPWRVSLAKCISILKQTTNK